MIEFILVYESGYREIHNEGGGSDFPPLTLSRDFMETPDKYIFSESWDQALQRTYHFFRDTPTLDRSTAPDRSKLVLFPCTSSYRFWLGQNETLSSRAWGSELSDGKVGKVVLAIKSSVRTFRKYILVGGFRQRARSCAGAKVKTLARECLSITGFIYNIYICHISRKIKFRRPFLQTKSRPSAGDNANFTSIHKNSSC